MAESHEAPGPTTAMDEEHSQNLSPALPLEEMAAANDPVERNEELEIAIRGALEGPDKDLGRLCKTLGENFCLAPPRPRAAVRAAGYDSGSDTTSPADQEHSSGSSSGSETGGDHHAATAVSGGAAGGGQDKDSSEQQQQQDDILQAVAAAARVSKTKLFLWVAGVLVAIVLPSVNAPSGFSPRDR